MSSSRRSRFKSGDNAGRRSLQRISDKEVGDILLTIGEQHARLLELEEYFQRLEKASLAVTEAPLGSYLAFRMDGIKASKRYLKNELINFHFSHALHRAITGVYFLFRQCTGREHGEHHEGNFFLCAITQSDEVSFILNNRQNHLENRLFKTGTSLASTLSAQMTLNFKEQSARLANNGHHPQVITFDARPLVFAHYEEVEEYVRYRWLIGCRNAMAKVLRLCQLVPEQELFGTTLKHDVQALARLIGEHQREEDLLTVLSGFSIFLPEAPTRTANLNTYAAEFDGSSADPVQAVLMRLRALREKLDRQPTLAEPQ